MATLTGAPLEPSSVPCDPHDLAALYQTWFRSVYRWIRALGGPGIDAEDLAQEVFIVVQRKLAIFDGENLAGWLYRIVQFTVRDHRQRAWFRNIFLRSRDVVLDEVVSSAPRKTSTSSAWSKRCASTSWSISSIRNGETAFCCSRSVG
jgi:DNA-directed RNA polymerase specialized sigma24 family protein